MPDAQTQHIAELEAQIAALQRQLRDAQRPPPLPIHQVGDQVRVIGDSRAGPKAPIPFGTVGTVVEVCPKCQAQIVYHNCLDLVYLLDFGPDEGCAGGRDTWAYADADVQAVDAPWRQRRGRR